VGGLRGKARGRDKKIVKPGADGGKRLRRRGEGIGDTDGK